VQYENELRECFSVNDQLRECNGEFKVQIETLKTNRVPNDIKYKRQAEKIKDLTDQLSILEAYSCGLARFNKEMQQELDEIKHPKQIENVKRLLKVINLKNDLRELYFQSVIECLQKVDVDEDKLKDKSIEEILDIKVRQVNQLVYRLAVNQD
jgi:hypothetical protein